MSADESPRPRVLRSVFDASPILHLTRLEALDWLSDGEWVCAPESVLDELTADSHRDGAEEIRWAMESGWIRLRAPESPLHPDDLGWDGGEADCLRLYREQRAAEIVTDDVPFGRHLSRLAIPFRNTPLWIADGMTTGRIARKRGAEALRQLRGEGIWSAEVWAWVGVRSQLRK